MKRLLAITILAFALFGPYGLEGETVKHTVGTATRYYDYTEEATDIYNILSSQKERRHPVILVKYDGKREIKRIRPVIVSKFKDRKVGETQHVIVTVRKMKNWIGFPKGEKVFIRPLPKKERV